MSTLNPYFYAYNPELLAFENAWVQFVKEGDAKEDFIRSVIKEEVYASWVRCKRQGINPLSREKLPLLSDQEIQQRRMKNQDLLYVVEPFMDNLYNIIKNSGFRVDFIDTDGYILRSLGDEETLEICEKTNSFVGANRAESVAGTSSTGLTLITGKPIQVSGAEHYCQMYQRWACSSAPIIGPQGEILGVLTASGLYELVHIHTLGMISSTAKAIGDELYIQKINIQMAESNSQLRATFETVTDGVVYIEKGKVMQINKEMCTLIGKSANDVIGKDVSSVIITTPSLEEVTGAEYKLYKDSEIILKGEKQNVKCLLDFRAVHGNNDQEIGKVIILTRVDEIQLLASKIKYSPKFTFNDIIGESELIRSAIDIAKKASEYDSRIIIEGASGTGKEMFAQAIHNNSSRKYGPFVAIDCGSLPKELLESELFGYDSGAFTGAKKGGKIGLFEIANKGTVFLDEVGNMPMDMQVKLLRVLQEGVFTRIGSTTPISSDVRVIAATNANLKMAVEEGIFRSDLFYRLNVFYISLPSLKERKEDIPLLTDHFLKTNALYKSDIRIDKHAIQALQENSWPGNIRQLNNAIERALIMSNGQQICLTDLPVEITGGAQKGTEDTSSMTLEDKTREYILTTLKQNDNNVSKTSKVLNVSRSTVYKAITASAKREENGDDL